MDPVAALVLTAAIAAAAFAAVAIRASRRARDLEERVSAIEASDGDRLARAIDDADRLGAAIDALTNGVIVRTVSGEVVLRNAAASAMLDDPVGGAILASAIERVVAALEAPVAHAEEPVDLFGPPRRSLVVSASALVAGNPPRVIGVLVVIEDVSERKHFDAVRRDFVANMSHELKTPVGALGLLAETLLDEPDPEVGRRLAARMQDEAYRVNRIIEDLLDLSRIESQPVERRDPVPVSSVVSEATERLRQAAAQRDVDLDVADVAPGANVLGDHRQLVSAVHSLVENAIAYTEPGGRVRVEAVRTGPVVRIIVADTGVGIPARDLDRIFERFYRVDRARARATGGTGLGLSIVRHVAQNHGGTVQVESQEGVGSTFTLELPAGPLYLVTSVEPRPEEAAG